MHLFLALRPPLAEALGTTLPACPGLARLLHHAGQSTQHAATIAQLLAPRYGVARQVDWPFAPLCLEALGHAAGTHWWLAADPVTFVADRDDLTLTGRAERLTPEESTALLTRLNAHFAADGLVFVAPRPDRWFLRAPRPMDLATTPLCRAVGQPLFSLQPQGADAGLWRRWRSEIEMLLHDDPVNTARPQRGLPPVNGVWLSGGGLLPPRVSHIVAPVTFADDEELLALALHAGNPQSPLPAQLTMAVTEAARDRDIAVMIDDSSSIADFEQHWAAPAWQRLLRDQIASATTMLDDGVSTRVWTTVRPAWRARLAGRFALPDLATLLAPPGRASS